MLFTKEEAKKYANTIDRDIAEEVYAKLVALRLHYEINGDNGNGHFDPNTFEQYYHIALKIVKEKKLSKLQLCFNTVAQSQELEKVGFTKEHLLNLASLDIK
jgi:hypothetical protein